VHYWATWCPSCAPELRVLADVARACAGSGVRVLAVDVGESAEEVRRYLAEHALDLPVALDPEGRTWRRAGGRELPANLVWTASERRVSFGPSDADAWRARLAALGCPPAPGR
jgi:thiol-disulfide isomerase/thioredoxin